MSISISNLDRRLSGMQLVGSSLESPSMGLRGWGTFSAGSHISVEEFEQIMKEIKKAADSKSNDEATETMLKKHCFRLTKILIDPEIGERFGTNGGLNGLLYALATLKGSSLAYAVNALRTFATHEFAVDTLVQSFAVQTQIWNLLKTNSSNVGVLKSLLSLLCEMIQRTSNGFGFVMSLHFQNGNGLFTLIVNSCLSRSAGLDVQVATMKLINTLLTTAKDAKQFNAVLEELNANGSRQDGPPFQSELNALKDDLSPALKDELLTFTTIQKSGFKTAELSNAQRKEIAALKAQLSDISQLATEYRSTTARLENELKNFKRREPLVQLLWAEIQQLRGAMNVAIAAGFAYDLSDPSCRYVKPSHFAYIDRLDVSRWAPHSTHQQQDMTAGSENNDAPSAPSAANAAGKKHHQPAGMRSGDDSQAMQESLSSAFSSPLSGPIQPGTISYDMPPGSTPDAPPMAPAMGASAPFAPPMAPGAPMAPPMAPAAPGIPGPPGAPGPPSAPGAPRMQGPQPTKKVVKPPRKMKALHWTRILLPVGSDKSMWSSIGNRLDQIEAKVPCDEIDKLFAEQKKEKSTNDSDAPSPSSPSSASANNTLSSGSKTQPSSQQRENVRILSDKRFNAVAIMLSFLPSTEQVVAGIHKLDLNLLDKDQISALHKQMPSEDEVSSILNSGCQTSELAKPEAFLLTLATSIPCVSSRIDCWHFANSFKECYEDLKTPFEIIQSAIHAVQQSKCLPILCAIVLHCGNFINGSTPRGQADGFDLSLLTRLHMIKDSTGSGSTLLQFVVTKVLEMEGLEFGKRFVEELGPCRAAAEFPLRPALTAATRFQGLIKTQKNLAALVVAGTENSIDPFTGFMATFARESEDAGTKLRLLGQSCNDAFGELLFYLNPSVDATTAAKTQSEELFQTLYEFAESVNFEANKRKAEIETEIQQKKQAEIRERQQAARTKLANEKAAAAAAAAAATPNK